MAVCPLMHGAPFQVAVWHGDGILVTQVWRKLLPFFIPESGGETLSPKVARQRNNASHSSANTITLNCDEFIYDKAYTSTVINHAVEQA